MRTICFYFQVHQPFRFRRYRFFDIGNDHYYYDDFSNESILRKVADKCYLPANALMLDLIKRHKGNFSVAYSISGVAMEQFKLYAPEVLDSFKELASTGRVEFLAETYAHSLSSLKENDEFDRQVKAHAALMKEHFGREPEVFRNTELVYSDKIGSMVSKLGYKAMLTEGAKHVLGWKSPNYLYCNAINPKLKLLLKNFKLSDDIAFRFSDQGWGEYPLTAEKFVGWLNQIPKNEEVVNLFMDYETFGEHQWKESGIFNFLKALPETVFKNSGFTFSTPSEVVKKLQVISAVNVPNPISWADEERDLTAWLGNEMQHEAFDKLYSLSAKVSATNDPAIQQDYAFLQVSDHFYYMSTKFFSDGDVHSYFNPYNTPYDAFINYMNILSDFEIRVNASVEEPVDEAIARLSKIIKEKDDQLAQLEKQVTQREMIKKPAKSTTGTSNLPHEDSGVVKTTKAKPTKSKSTKSKTIKPMTTKPETIKPETIKPETSKSARKNTGKEKS